MGSNIGWKLLTNNLKENMARELKPISTTDKLAALEAISNYKKQNPAKFEAKKEALFKKYGLELNEVELPKDETDEKMDALKTKLSKNK